MGKYLNLELRGSSFTTVGLALAVMCGCHASVNLKTESSAAQQAAQGAAGNGSLTYLALAKTFLQTLVPPAEDQSGSLLVSAALLPDPTSLVIMASQAPSAVAGVLVSVRIARSAQEDLCFDVSTQAA